MLYNVSPSFVTYTGPTAGGAGNRQMVPGLLVLPEANRANVNSYSQLKGKNWNMKVESEYVTSYG